MLLRLILLSIACQLALASRFNKRVRTQLARDMTVVIRSDDGVARSFLIHARQISSQTGATPNATCILTFRSASLGARILLAPDAIGRIVVGLGSGTVQCQGDAAIVLWFYQLIMGLVPGMRAKAKSYPDGYIAANPNLKAADRITREPAVAALDASAHKAQAGREGLMIWQVGSGAEVSGKVVNHQIVVDVPDMDMAANS
jgi:hypothetical protein